MNGYTGHRPMVAHNMVTTQFELDGFRVVRTMGVVRGIIVRSRSVFGTIGASLQTILGGNITLLTNLCERTRADASISCSSMLPNSAQTPLSERVMMRLKSCRASLRCWLMERRFSWNLPGSHVPRAQVKLSGDAETSASSGR